MNQLKRHFWYLLMIIGTVMFLIHSSLVTPETSFTIWLTRLGYLFFFCGVIVGGVEEYMKKHKISAYILFGIGILMIFDFFWLQFLLHMF
ncbi:hypothetical protein BN000_03389 [Neobacillus massiliamazoniensis]|uniref:Uncharacterized protein n=1 Tax=Neobacillus massiliamazoniensis TaxID=1499688 RepID=A0A0U1NZI1_9BACI|nr:hypothetical protein BN000_03389 [Neobacillus massiliamazoniensis]